MLAWMGQIQSRPGLPSHDVLEDLFDALTKPDELKAYLQRSNSLEIQVELLCSTLRVDAALLKVGEVGESFDTATFCLGQLVSHEPQLMSGLPCARAVVDGLSAAIRKGWAVHHGVGKFAANALTILAITESADSGVREHAVDELLGGMAEWLTQTDEPFEPKEEVDEVCGCNCASPALSAACWLERLLGKPDALLERKVQAHPQLDAMGRHLFDVVARRDGNPFALTRLLCVPQIFARFARDDLPFFEHLVGFIAFGILQFDNPMFSDDSIPALQALFRDDPKAAEVVMSSRMSIALLEALANAAGYLPSAMTTIGTLAAAPGGRVALYSLAAKLTPGGPAGATDVVEPPAEAARAAPEAPATGGDRRGRRAHVDAAAAAAALAALDLAEAEATAEAAEGPPPPPPPLPRTPPSFLPPRARAARTRPRTRATTTTTRGVSARIMARTSAPRIPTAARARPTAGRRPGIAS